MSQYTLLPGTNQLIRKHSDEGAKLFHKWGYHIPHPRYRDYYNGLRRHGMPFFDDLGALLGGLFGAASAVAGAVHPTRLPQVPTGTLGSMGSLTDKINTPATLSPIDLSSSYTGHTTAHRMQNFFRLRQYLWLRSQEERDPRYFSNITYVVGAPVSPVVPQFDPQPDPAPQMPYVAPEETWFGINKKIAIVGMIIIAAIIYKKFIK